jgi:hypothetical protein
LTLFSLVILNLIASESIPIVGAFIHREKSEWEKLAENILKNMCKHPFVDPLKPSVIADFMTPIDSSVNKSYCSKIKNPMDLSTLSQRLDNGTIKDADEFYSLLLSVFQNAIDFNAPFQNDYEHISQLIKRLEQLVKYVHWLCLESFPVPQESSGLKKNWIVLN